MRRIPATALLFAVWCLGAQPKNFSGESALALTGKAVGFGPRPSGSTAMTQQRAWIKQQLATKGCELTSDKFTGQTPDGPVTFENLIARFPGKSGKAIAITGHYDTKKMPGFVGANDGGSSTGFLLELAAALQGRPRTDDVYLVFFDGEEAVREWTDTDSLYGSRHLAEKWTADGTTRKLKALINIDMIGDKNFRVVWEENSAASLRTLVWGVADSLGFSSSFPRQGGPVTDDHMPFLTAGVKSLDLIDFDSQSTFWHTTRDTMDKLSARSFDILGTVILKSIEQLELQK
ncbi:MAG TPA: M28 family peptidase [Bryobacteraceae bacterium]|nr:M28 family peptidase [Bryobacteraceae bacterium]